MIAAMLGLRPERHQQLVTYEAEAEDLTSDIVVQRILDGVAVP